MSIADYALVSLVELKEHVLVAGTAKDTQLEDIINRVSGELETYLGRQIVSRGSLTEYHTMLSNGCAVCAETLHTLERPIISVTSVHEDDDVPRTYGSDYLLVANEDYEVVKPKGIIRRIDGLGSPICWSTGHRSIKVVYTGGYTSTATVPGHLKKVALDYAALIWDEQKRGAFGVSGASDTLGNFTRFAAAQITPAMKAALASERAAAHWRSGERDS